jgi:5' nucleotidase family
MNAAVTSNKQVLRQESLRFHNSFHPAWGQLFKSGYQDSRFAQQVSKTYTILILLLDVSTMHTAAMIALWQQSSSTVAPPRQSSVY